MSVSKPTSGFTRLTAGLATTLAAVVAGLSISGALAGPAEAAAGYCPRGTGATVVVDFGPLGGGVEVGCDPGGAHTPASTVVERLAFSLTYVQRQPGFVCRVNGKPANDPCVATPPSNAYWGLFSSDGTSGTWKYSSVGIGGLEVPAGGFIGLRWQDGGTVDFPGAKPLAPALNPSPTAKSSPSPAPSPSRTSQPGPRPPRTSQLSAAPTSAQPTGGSPTPVPANPTATAPKSSQSHAGPQPSSGPSHLAAPAPVTSTVEPPGAPSTDQDGRSALVPVAVAVVALLLAASVVLARRRA